MSSTHYGDITGDLADEGAEVERAYLAWLNEYTLRERDTSYDDDLRAAFTAGASAERLRLSRTVGLITARLRDAATELDSQPWAGREHLAGSSFQAVCWCQIAHTAAQASALNGEDGT